MKNPCIYKVQGFFVDLKGGILYNVRKYYLCR